MCLLEFLSIGAGRRQPCHQYPARARRIGDGHRPVARRRDRRKPRYPPSATTTPAIVRKIRVLRRNSVRAANAAAAPASHLPYRAERGALCVAPTSRSTRLAKSDKNQGPSLHCRAYEWRAPHINSISICRPHYIGRTPSPAGTAEAPRAARWKSDLDLAAELDDAVGRNS